MPTTPPPHTPGDAVLEPSPPASAVGLAYFAMRQYGMAVLSLVFLIVCAVIFGYLYKTVAPDLAMLRDISDNMRDTATAQTVVSEQYVSGIDRLEKQSDALRDIADALRDSAQRIEESARTIGR